MHRAFFALVAGLMLLPAAGALPTPRQAKPYAGFDVVLCGPPPHQDDDLGGGACFSLNPWAWTVRIEVRDDVFPHAAATYRLEGFPGFPGGSGVLCDAKMVPVPPFPGLFLELRVVMLDPAQATLVCGQPAGATTGTITATAT